MLHEYSIVAKNLRLGNYLHYKGNTYRVMQVALDHETLEELVVYKALSGENNWFVRPLKMFTETVEIDGVVKPRFLYVEE